MIKEGAVITLDANEQVLADLTESELDAFLLDAARKLTGYGATKVVSAIRRDNDTSHGLVYDLVVDVPDLPPPTFEWVPA